MARAVRRVDLPRTVVAYVSPKAACQPRRATILRHSAAIVIWIVPFEQTVRKRLLDRCPYPTGRLFDRGKK